MELTPKEIQELSEIARRLRVLSLKMIYQRQAGHPGGSLSAAEILTLLYFKILRINPQQPHWNERDRFILSKGHASALLYAALALNEFFSVTDLENWGNLDCHLQGHPDRLKTPGVDMNSGILGHGIAIGVGLALAARQKQLNYHTYVLLGDGECQAGIVWEGANTAAKFKLSNLTAIVDSNGLQLDGMVKDIMPIEPLAKRWIDFGWNVIEADGHNIPDLYRAFLQAKQFPDKPGVIIAHTVKGKSVSFMENKSEWHGVAPNALEIKQASLELGEES